MLNAYQRRLIHWRRGTSLLIERSREQDHTGDPWKGSPRWPGSVCYSCPLKTVSYLLPEMREERMQPQPSGKQAAFETDYKSILL